MYFRLASELGYAHPDDLLGGLSSRQISEWLAYRRMEMLAGERTEYLLATIAALIANQQRGEGDEPVTPAQFMPWVEQADEDETGERDWVGIIEGLNAAFGGRDLRQHERSDELHHGDA